MDKISYFYSNSNKLNWKWCLVADIILSDIEKLVNFALWQRFNAISVLECIDKHKAF